MSGSAPMVGPPDGSFAEGAFAHQQSGVLESIDLAQSPTPRALRAYSQASSELGVLAQPEGGAPVLLPQEEKLSPDALNQKYGIPGNLTFTDPLTEGSAASIYASHIDQIKQRDIEQRAPPGFVSGATRFGAQFAAGFLDPLQLGAAMVPVVPEFELGASVGARLATAGLRGAAAGTAGNLPLVGLQAAMSRSEYSDYTAYDALFDLAHGAALGSGIEILGAGGGAFGRALSQRYRASRAGPAAEADPGIAPSALKTGLGQMEQDNPVEVRPVYDQSNSPNVPEDYGAPSPLQEPGTRGATAFLPESEPKGLTQFLKEDFTVGREGDVNSERRAGGLKDAAGDLDAIIGGSKGRPGLINNESGSSLNEAATRAYEGGYFDHVPDENELLDAIAKDHNRTNPHDAIYSSRDQDAADDYRYARDHNVEVDKMSAETGISTEGQTPTQFWDQVADHLSQEDALSQTTRLDQEHAEAFEQAEQAAHTWMAEGHEGASAEDLYRGVPHTLEEMEHEWRQAEAANPVLSGEGGGGQPGPSSPDQGAVQGGVGQVASAAESTGRTDPQERSQTLQSALRDAAGRKPPDPTSLAAERSLTEGKPDNLVKQAQQDIEDHEEFFRRMSEANAPTDRSEQAMNEVLNETNAKRLAPKDFAEAADTVSGSRHGIITPDGRIFQFDQEQLPDTHAQYAAEFLRRRAKLEGRPMDYETERAEGLGGTVSFNSLGKAVGIDPSTPMTERQLSAVRAIEGVMKREGGEVHVGEPFDKPRVAVSEVAPYAGLTAEIQAELERINGLDKEASDLTAAARQAAACIARGIA